MNQKIIIVCIALFILIVVGMFAFAYIRKNEISETVTETKVQVDEGEVKYPSITRITAKHYYINGVHTLAGEIPLPTPCDLLEVTSAVKESAPEQVGLIFTVINNAEVCAEQITNQRFKVSAEAGQDATFSAIFMGRQVELNLVPAGEGETPDDFELYIKG